MGDLALGLDGEGCEVGGGVDCVEGGGGAGGSWGGGAAGGGGVFCDVGSEDATA